MIAFVEKIAGSQGAESAVVELQGHGRGILNVKRLAADNAREAGHLLHLEPRQVKRQVEPVDSQPGDEAAAGASLACLPFLPVSGVLEPGLVGDDVQLHAVDLAEVARLQQSPGLATEGAMGSPAQQKVPVFLLPLADQGSEVGSTDAGRFLCQDVAAGVERRGDGRGPCTASTLTRAACGWTSLSIVALSLKGSSSFLPRAWRALSTLSPLGSARPTASICGHWFSAAKYDSRSKHPGLGDDADANSFRHGGVYGEENQTTLPGCGACRGTGSLYCGLFGRLVQPIVLPHRGCSYRLRSRSAMQPSSRPDKG